MGTNWRQLGKETAPHFAGAVLILCAGMPSPASAQTSGAVTLQAAHDSNVFRAQQGTVLANGACRSDQSAQAQGQLDHSFGESLAVTARTPASWSGTLSGTVSDTRFRCNTALNHAAGSAQAHLASPAFGPLSFTLDPTLARQQTSLEFVGSTGINAQFLGQVSGSAGLHITPDLALIVRPQFTYSRNTSPLLAAQNYNKYGYQAGISYVSGLGNSISILAKINKIRGPRAIDQILNANQFDVRTNYRERGVDLTLNYAVSPLTRFNVDLGYLKWLDLRNIPAAAANYPKSYGGFVGNFRATYQPSSLTSVEFSASRQFSSLDLLFVSGIVFDNAYVSVSKKIADRLSGNVKIQMNRQRFIQNNAGTVNQSDRNKLFGVDAELHYTLSDRLNISLYYSRQKRLSGGLLNPFSENAARIQLVYNFGKSAP